MPKKIRELLRDLSKAGWTLEKGGKGSHRKFAHRMVARKVTVSGQEGADAKPYQEKDIRMAVAEAAQAEKEKAKQEENKKK